jgi:hypothetical protein
VPDREEQRDRCAVARLTVSTWRWGTRYGSEYVDRLRSGVARNLRQAYDFRAFSPQAEDEHLTAVPGCFCRLRMFDPVWQAHNGFKPGDRILNLDLDLIVTGSLDALLSRPEPFSILSDVNSANPCWANGSAWWTTAGYRPDVWTDFSLKAANELPAYEFADDQLWLAHKLPDAGRITSADGAYGFQKKNWPKGEALPKNASIVAFPGWRDPSGFTHLDWVKRHWIGEKVAA